jgi:hypothetical protein
MSTRATRWATTSARLVGGAVVAGAAVAAVAIAVTAPWPTLSAEPVRVVATPAPSDAVLACAGPLLAQGRVVEQAADLGVAAAQSVTVADPAGTAARSALAAPADSAPLVLTAPPADSARAAVGAAGSATVESSDLRGFAASACHPALSESWLVGGSTLLGSSDLIVLSNPGDVTATVSMTVFGADGAIESPGGSDQIVPARTQVVVPLAGVVPNEESPVVRVSATGAPVAAALQSSLVRTLDPGGVDQMSPLASAARRLTVPGVAVASAPGEAGASNAATLVRLLSPSADATARVAVHAADGSPVLEVDAVPLTAGIPAEVELATLPVGRYTVVVQADAPVVGGVWSTTGFGQGSDFAWYAAAPEITTPSPFAVPAGPAPVLTVTNPSASAVELTLAGASGDERRVRVGPAASVDLPVTAGSTGTIDPSSAVTAAISYSAAGALGGFPLWGADAAAGPIVVYP